MIVFYKDLKNFFIPGAFPRNYLNRSTGVTQNVEYTTTRSGGDGKLEGFEIAYQQFYDMLPAPWDGFGIQANYTYIDSEGIPNFEGSEEDRKSTRLNSSHVAISYAVFCLIQKTITNRRYT